MSCIISILLIYYEQYYSVARVSYIGGFIILHEGKPRWYYGQAQQALGTSQELVRRYRHSQWDSEHILMALLEQDKGVPIDILTEMGVSVDAMRARLNEILGQAPRVGGVLHRPESLAKL